MANKYFCDACGIQILGSPGSASFLKYPYTANYDFCGDCHIGALGAVRRFVTQKKNENEEEGHTQEGT